MRVHFVNHRGKILTKDIETGKVLSESQRVSEAIKKAIDEGYIFPEQAFNGEFIKLNDMYVYYTDNGYELEDGTYIDGKVCQNCGWITQGKEIIDEDKENRLCYVCPKCGFVEECTPSIEDIGEAD